MGIHLLVIGSRPDTVDPIDHLMDVVARSVKETETFIMTRATRAASLPDIVALVAKRAQIDVLDVFDHGRPGFQYLGDGPIFSYTKKDGFSGAGLAQEISQYLSDTAHLRLLGCDVAGDAAVTPSLSEARVLIYRLGAILGARRTAFGSVRSVGASAFDVGGTGFRRDIERDFLFSSGAALDNVPPSWEKRKENLLAMSW